MCVLFNLHVYEPPRLTLTFYVDVQRFDSRLMPLDGPSGLTHKVGRLLDTSARALDAKKKQELLQRLDRVVQHPR